MQIDAELDDAAQPDDPREQQSGDAEGLRAPHRHAARARAAARRRTRTSASGASPSTRWLRSLGIDDLHCVNPTYDGDGDLVGRDAQFLRDRSVGGGLPSARRRVRQPQRDDRRSARPSCWRCSRPTAPSSPADSATVRRRMQRDPEGAAAPARPHRRRRRAHPRAQVYAKSGTWGPIYADAGIVRAPDRPPVRPGGIHRGDARPTAATSSPSSPTAPRRIC